MRNTTKLKHILQLYTVSLDMDEDDNFHLVLISKKNHSSSVFTGKSYSGVISKAFSSMMKDIKMNK